MSVGRHQPLYLARARPGSSAEGQQARGPNEGSGRGARLSCQDTWPVHVFGCSRNSISFTQGSPLHALESPSGLKCAFVTLFL